MDAPWRCSECGTINEPVANACRTCGRWPSLFDLQESLVDEVEPEITDEPEPGHVMVQVGDIPLPVPIDAPESEPFEPEAFEVEKPDAPAPETSSERGRRIIGSVIVPLAVVIYLVVTFIVNR